MFAWIVLKMTSLIIRKENLMSNQNIYELMCQEWDIYEENWIIKMQSVGLVKQDLTEKEFNQLFEFLTHY